jgi:hypothetical protein
VVAVDENGVDPAALLPSLINQNPFRLWSCWDRAANSFEAKPPRLAVRATASRGFGLDPITSADIGLSMRSTHRAGPAPRSSRAHDIHRRFAIPGDNKHALLSAGECTPLPDYACSARRTAIV